MGPQQQSAFDCLKHEIAHNVTSFFPLPDARFRLETDASNYAVGVVLHQIVDGKPQPLGFFSKTMGEAERNYQIYDKELLAIMLALKIGVITCAMVLNLIFGATMLIFNIFANLKI